MAATPDPELSAVDPTTQTPTDPSLATAAQIPLRDFNLPTFPDSLTALKSLTLTADIIPSDYTSLLEKPYSIPPSLPPNIENLTLELFSAGYPPGFLSELASRLGKLTSLVLYSQLLGGISEKSARDTIGFFAQLQGLRALHLVDVFAREGVFASVGSFLRRNGRSEGPIQGDEKDGQSRKGLMFLEVNYAARHGDEEFLTKVPAGELPLLIGPDLVTLALNVSEADETDDPHDPENARQDSPAEGEGEKSKEHELQKDGIMTFNKTSASALVRALTNADTKPVDLKVLNTTLYTITLDNAESILEKHTRLLILMITLEVDDADLCRTRLLKMLGDYGSQLEQIEIVVSPTLKFFMALNKVPSNALEQALPSKSDLEALGTKCPSLGSVKANVLRSKHMTIVDWEKTRAAWQGGVEATYRTVGSA